MKSVGFLIGFLALAAFLMPGLTAQEKKGDDPKKDKAEAKDGKDEKKDAKDAKDEKKDVKDAKKGDPEKKDSEKDEKKEVKKDKEKKPVETVPEHGQVLKSKIVSMRPDSAREFTIEIPVFDPERMMALKVWQAQQMASLAQAQSPADYAQRMAQLQMQMAQKQATETYKMKPVDFKMAESCKLRVMFPPMQYDEAGHAKKWTKKELDALHGNSKLPGYPADFDVLKPGQFVEVYLAKQAKTAPAKDKSASPKKKKGDDDPPDPWETRPEVVMIVIVADPTAGK